jgi:hypothetical protein
MQACHASYACPLCIVHKDHRGTYESGREGFEALCESMHTKMERKFAVDAKEHLYPFDEKGQCFSSSGGLLLVALPRGSKERTVKGEFGQVHPPLLRFVANNTADIHDRFQAKDIVFDELHMLLRIMDR